LVVDFAIKKFSGCTVATVTYVGPYKGDNMMHDEFNKLVAWAKEKKLRTGKWFFIELDGPEVPSKKRRYEACIELRGRARSSKGIRIKKLPASPVASIRFDPKKVSPRVIYHGLESWLQWRKKDGKYKETGDWREVYKGDPWTNAHAWADVEVQAPVKRLG
jgi:DNA gyrase inhibitor GyrI